MSDSDIPRLAIVGCGAITKRFHLPALARYPAVMRNAVLVDQNHDQASALARQFGAADTASDLTHVLDTIDCAIIATPHHLHFPLSLQCVERGRAILVEKPLAGSAAEAEQLLMTAERNKVAIAVNNIRRILPAPRRVHELVANGAIGELREVVFVQGEVFDWPATTDAYFGVKADGHGVLTDVGAHVVDLVCWWLGEVPTIVRYRDDSYGGTEAVACVEFRFSGGQGRIELSWLSKRPDNGYRLVGTRGEITGGVYDHRNITVKHVGRNPETIKLESPERYAEYAVSLVGNFLDVVAGRALPFVNGHDVLPSLRLIEECYARRERFVEPWHDAWRRLADD